MSPASPSVLGDTGSDPARARVISLIDGLAMEQRIARGMPNPKHVDFATSIVRFGDAIPRTRVEGGAKGQGVGSSTRGPVVRHRQVSPASRYSELRTTPGCRNSRTSHAVAGERAGQRLHRQPEAKPM